MLLPSRGFRGVNILVLALMRRHSEALMTQIQPSYNIIFILNENTAIKIINSYTWTLKKAVEPVHLVIILDRSPKNLVVSDWPFLHIWKWKWLLISWLTHGLDSDCRSAIINLHSSRSGGRVRQSFAILWLIVTSMSGEIDIISHGVDNLDIRSICLQK